MISYYLCLDCFEGIPVEFFKEHLAIAHPKDLAVKSRDAVYLMLDTQEWRREHGCD